MIALTAASAVYSYLPGANLVRASAQLRSRPALLIAPIDAPVDGAATVETVSDIADMEGVVKPNSSRTGLVSKQAALNRQLSQAESSDEVLQLVEQNAAELNAVNVATALHRIASRNKVKRARRDAVLMDRRFQLLITALEVHAADGMSNEPRSVADVLWSFGTMKHWPPSLLKPMLMSVLGHLEKGTFEAQHLSTVVWAFAKLETKPVRLLEQIEAQATELVAKLTMQVRPCAPRPASPPTLFSRLLRVAPIPRPTSPPSHSHRATPTAPLVAEHRQPDVGLRKAQLRAGAAAADARARAGVVRAVRHGQAGRGGGHHVRPRVRRLERAGRALRAPCGACVRRTLEKLEPSDCHPTRPCRLLLVSHQPEPQPPRSPRAVALTPCCVLSCRPQGARVAGRRPRRLLVAAAGDDGDRLRQARGDGGAARGRPRRLARGTPPRRLLLYMPLPL